MIYECFTPKNIEEAKSYCDYLLSNSNIIPNLFRESTSVATETENYFLSPQSKFTKQAANQYPSFITKYLDKMNQRSKY